MRSSRLYGELFSQGKMKTVMILISCASHRVPEVEEKIIRPESDHSKALSLTYSCCGDLIDVTLADA